MQALKKVTMLQLLLIVIVTLVSMDGIGQINKAYVVHAGEIPDKVLPAEALYTFPTFRQGTVYLRWDPLESTCRHASLSIL